jgi:manganese transport protein
MATHSSTAPALTPSLEDIHSSVPIPPRSWWRRFLAFSGPAFLISVGYMDPGNWGGDLEAGSNYGYRLLWVLLASNLMALLLQTLASRLGIVAGRDLAQACRESYPRRTVIGLWLLSEIAIAATDLAEVIGTIIALKLLFSIPYLIGLAIAAADTFVLLATQRRGVRLLEMLTLALIGVIAVSFTIEIIFARPDWAAVVRGFVPGFAVPNPDKYLYIASSLLGATVMPHNLYLHSALVQTRAFAQTDGGKQQACKYNFFDSLIALNGAFLVNAAILIVAAATFYQKEEVEKFQRAYEMLSPLLGAAIASTLFAVALLASGQSSTLTGTLAGQVVMEGFVSLRVRPWVRRLLTRLAAIVPAVIVLSLAAGSGGKQSDERLFDLLVLSQVILSFQLPFAIVPLVQMTSDRRRMGVFANGTWLKVLAWICAALVVALNVGLIGMKLGEWGEKLEEANRSPWLIYGTVGPVALLAGGFLVWVTAYPLLRRPALGETGPRLTPPELPAVAYHRIGVAVEFNRHDQVVLSRAAALARMHPEAEMVVLHVVEGVGAEFFGAETANAESQIDRTRMAQLIDHLRGQDLRASGTLGFGDPPGELVRLANELRLDLLVLGTHGHRFFADLALGQTVAPVLHKLTIPVLVVPNGAAGSSDSIKALGGIRS